MNKQATSASRPPRIVPTTQSARNRRALTNLAQCALLVAGVLLNLHCSSDGSPTTGASGHAGTTGGSLGLAGQGGTSNGGSAGSVEIGGAGTGGAGAGNGGATSGGSGGNGGATSGGSGGTGGNGGEGGKVPVKTAPQPLPVDGNYARVIQRSNGTIVASIQSPQASGKTGGTIFESTDDGLSFHVIGHIDEPLASGNLCCTTLYELPRALGKLPAGALLWAASTGWGQTAAPMKLPVWSSIDGGKTWSPLSTIAAGVIYTLHHGLWEPEFSLLDDNTLVCHFSDETDPAHSQKLVEVRTTDGLSWSAPKETVALADGGLRPGMAIVRRGPAGVFYMSYEVCGVPGDNCTAHLRTSTDGWNWGSPTDIGLRPSTVDGKYFQHAPTLMWTSAPGQFGRFFLVGQVTFDKNGGVAAANGNFVMANAENATMPWYGIAAPTPVTPAPYDDSCPNYSSPLLPLDNGTVGLELASRYDGAVCRTYFARGPLLGTGDANGVKTGDTYRLQNVHSGLCLDVAGGSTSTTSKIDQLTCNGLGQQNWTFLQATDGTFSLKAQHSGLCLAPAAGADPNAPGTQLAQAQCDGSAAQAWTLDNVGLGYYELRHAGGVCLDNAGASTTSGTNVQQWTCNELSPQIWYLKGPWNSDVFFGQDGNGAGSDWDGGYFKGDCGSGAAVTGLSVNPTVTAAHALLCMTLSPDFSDGAGAVLTASGGNQVFSRDGDWDPGHPKVECALGQYVSGMSMDPKSNAIHTVRCSANASLTNGGQNACETHLLGQDDRGDTRSGDWDPFYFKAECSPGKAVYGVSFNATTSLPNRILCCDE